jgi:hypothetical protein
MGRVRQAAAIFPGGRDSEFLHAGAHAHEQRIVDGCGRTVDSGCVD